MVLETCEALVDQFVMFSESNEHYHSTGCYPTGREKHLRIPRQKIMLSATIGSPDDLSRRVGIPSIKTLPIPARFRLAVPGKRLLLMPNTDEHERQLETLALEVALRLKRSVWLCSSGNEASNYAKKLQDLAAIRVATNQPIFIAKARAEEIDDFVDSPSGHLFTAVGRTEWILKGNFVVSW